ncbi:MAG: acyl dehydratase [Pseudomonadales bacterium]|nr:acyl dehydratase [Pseudomonadales bacterium]
MTQQKSTSLLSRDVAVGDELTPLKVDVTATAIVAGAIASHDYMPMHHDRDFAQAQGAPDIFFNIMSTNAYIARFITDWAGPEAILKNISIRLGVQAVPGQTLLFSGTVTRTESGESECLVELAIKASVETGDHATGTAALTLPL